MLLLLDEALLAERLSSMAVVPAESVVGVDLAVDLLLEAWMTLRSSISRTSSGCASESMVIRSSVNGGVRNSRGPSLSDPIVETASKSKGSACNSVMSASLNEIPSA